MLELILRSLTGTLPWQLILEVKLAFLAYQPLFVALPFQNGLEYWNAGVNAAQLCTANVDRHWG